MTCEERNKKILNRITDTKIPLNKRFIDVTGQRFGRLTVTGYAGQYPTKEKFFWCHCDCGNDIIVLRSNLFNNHTTSCGCYSKEVSCKKSLTHGDSCCRNSDYKRLYRIWAGIKQRTTNPKCKNYKHYGGRKIYMCDDWFPAGIGYDNFKSWALANGYDNTKSIDRIDNDKGYYPENCRWVNNKIQGNNNSKNRYLVYNNYKFTVSIWADIIGISRDTLESRFRANWNIEEIILTPVGSEKGTNYINLIVPEEYMIYNKFNN